MRQNLQSKGMAQKGAVLQMMMVMVVVVMMMMMINYKET
jgi:hypothetical protein